MPLFEAEFDLSIYKIQRNRDIKKLTFAQLFKEFVTFCKNRPLMTLFLHGLLPKVYLLFSQLPCVIIDSPNPFSFSLSFYGVFVRNAKCNASGFSIFSCFPLAPGILRRFFCPDVR